jgi:hypothetical protein
MCAFFGLSLYFDHGSSFRLLFLDIECESNRPSFLVTVYYDASAFNGDLNQWDVANVNYMCDSKSRRILDNDLL